MIKLFVMDVDGTLTDGGIYYDDMGHELKKFNVKDGAGIKKLHDAKIETMILTGRLSQCVTKRAEELKITYVEQGMDDKVQYLADFMRNHHLTPDDVAYIGDDINDLACMKLVANKACPFDAVEEVKRTVNVICNASGGSGAVREYAEYILKK